MKTRSTIILMLGLLAGTAQAHWADWTPLQRGRFAKLVKAQSAVLTNPSTKNVYRRIVFKAVISATPQSEVVDRDKFQVAMEKFIKDMAVLHGWTRATPPARINTDLQAWIAAAPNDAKRAQRLYRSSLFWVAYAQSQNMTASGAATEVKHLPPIVVYADSMVEEIGIVNNDVDGHDIERGIRR